MLPTKDSDLLNPGVRDYDSSVYTYDAGRSRIDSEKTGEDRMNLGDAILKAREKYRYCSAMNPRISPNPEMSARLKKQNCPGGDADRHRV